ncbi:hypothetical protein OROMI_003808 [Orobanche minor]
MNSIKENSDARHLISKQSLSHGSDALSDDFSTLLQFKSICELDSTTECFKKVSVLDKSYWCEKCKMRPTSVLTRYKAGEDDSFPDELEQLIDKNFCSNWRYLIIRFSNELKCILF